MSFFDKAKAAASQAAAKTKQSAETLQLKVDLGSAYDDLGKAAYELIESGAIAHEQLDAPAAKVRELRARMEGEAKPEPEAAEPETPEVAAAEEPAAETSEAEPPA
jgi:hypothetical protein